MPTAYGEGQESAGSRLQDELEGANEHRGLGIEHSGDLSKGRIQDSSVKDPVAAALFLSIDYNSRDNAFAADYLFLAAYVDRKNISLDLLGAASIPAVDDDEERLQLVSRCATTLSSDGRYEEAEELEVQVMHTSKRVLDDEHPYTLTSIANLAATYRNQGRWKEAEELEVQVMQASKRVLSDEHPDTLTSMGNLASTYKNQGRWREAEELEVQVMQGRKRVLTDEHPHTLTSMHNLAFTLQLQARHEEAFALMERYFQLREQVLGEEHPDTQLSFNMLSSWRAECE
ncbi:TPR-12 multi-domain protein [Pyrenophora tritici-repentis]|nr:TPR-12 multi-domain protein [Pyrenophora tritici-repentis]